MEYSSGNSILTELVVVLLIVPVIVTAAGKVLEVVEK